MNKKITIREARADEWKAITALHVYVSQQSYAGLLPDDYLTDIMPDEKACLWKRRLSQGIDPERLCVTVAYDGTELAGFSCFLFDEKTEFGTYLHNLYVHPGHQGKGVARNLLITSIQRFSPEVQSRPVHLLTLANNHPARRFYERLNGQVVEEKRNVMSRYPDVAYVRYQWSKAAGLL